MTEPNHVLPNKHWNLMSMWWTCFVLTLTTLQSALAQVPPASIGRRNPAEVDSKVRLLETSVGNASQELRQVDERATQLQNKLKTLRDEVLAITAKPVKPPEEKRDTKKQAQKVKFRPPLERQTEKNSRIIVCEGGRLSDLDHAKLKVGVQKLGKTKIKDGVTFTYPGSFFKFVFRGEAIEMVRINGSDSLGETWDEANSSTSRFRRTLAETPTDKQYLDFIVYPDSHDVFRKARALAWEHKFDIDWSPIASGELVKLAAGMGGGTVQ